MLVLSRHRDESVVINGNVVVTVVDIRGDKVRLGVQAPADVPVHRQEVWEAIQLEESRKVQPVPEIPCPLCGKTLNNLNPGIGILDGRAVCLPCIEASGRQPSAVAR